MSQKFKGPPMWVFILIGAIGTFVYITLIRHHLVPGFSLLYETHVVPAHMETEGTLMGQVVEAFCVLGVFWGVANFFTFAQRRTGTKLYSD